MRTAPHHLPKKVTKKPSVNHIGSSNEPPTREISNLCGRQRRSSFCEPFRAPWRRYRMSLKSTLVSREGRGRRVGRESLGETGLKSYIEIIYFKKKQNKKVLLRERKRHTARRVVSTHSVVLSWLPPPPAG